MPGILGLDENSGNSQANGDSGCLKCVAIFIAFAAFFCLLCTAAFKDSYPQREAVEELLTMYDYVYPPFGDCEAEGLIVVCKDGKWFHVYSDGMPAYEERYDHVGHFVRGTSAVINGREMFLIRPDGTRAD